MSSTKSVKKYRGNKAPGPIEKKYETPDTHYKISSDKLIKLLQKMGKANYKDYGTLEKFFTEMKEYEDDSVPNVPKRANNNELVEVHQTKPKFEEKTVNALFWLPKLNAYKYLRIRIAPSNIKKAGMGAYAIDNIPKGAVGFYRGIPKTEKYVNMFYSWVIKSYGNSGEVDEDDAVLYYVDATDPRASNWTRYVNCGSRERENNFDSDQNYDKIQYKALRNIPDGEELYIDYGDEYRRDNLGMTGKY